MINSLASLFELANLVSTKISTKLEPSSILIPSIILTNSLKLDSVKSLKLPLNKASVINSASFNASSP